MAALVAACGRVNFDIDDSPRGDASAYQTAVLSAGPIAYYPFDEAAGPRVHDVVGALDADGEGAFLFGQPGAIIGSEALQFDGSTTRIDFGDSLRFGGNASYSFELWFLPTAVDSTRFLVDRESDADPTEGYSIYFGDGYLLAARTHAGQESSYVDTGGTRPRKWSYVVATLDWPVPRLYIDGRLVSENLGAMTTIGSSAGHFVLGDKTPPQFFKFEGKLDELAIYDRALTADEVAEHWRIARQ